MKKTMLYFRPEELAALHREAKARKTSVAALVRKAIYSLFIVAPRDPRPGYSLIALYNGPVPEGFSSDNHDAAFDDLGDLE